MSVLALAFAIAIVLIPALSGCTSVREAPPQLTTDTTGHELANKSCLFFCTVTGTFHGSTARASNTGSARSTDSSNFSPDVKPVNTLRPVGRKKGAVVVPIPVPVPTPAQPRKE